MNRRYVITVTLTALVGLGATLAVPAQALVGAAVKGAAVKLAPIFRSAKVLRHDEVEELAQLARTPGGTKAVGEQIAKRSLSPAAVEDAYLRIAIQQGTLGRAEAEGMFRRLSGVPGFGPTARKLIGNSDAKAAGHLNELRIADQASEHGLKVRGIGVSFKDPNKAGTTDIDVVLESKGRIIAVEAKDYLPTTPIPMDSFRADMLSLTEYAAAARPQKVIPVFSITNLPSDRRWRQLLTKEAARRGVRLVHGSPAAQANQIRMLLEIL